MVLDCFGVSLWNNWKNQRQRNLTNGAYWDFPLTKQYFIVVAIVFHLDPSCEMTVKFRQVYRNYAPICWNIQAPKS